MSSRAKQKTRRGRHLQKIPPAGLNDQQREAVRLLCIENKKVYEAAAVLGVHRSTIWRWKQNKAFWREWEKQLNAYMKEWRKQHGLDKERAARRARLKKLEAEVRRESEKIKTKPTKAFDRAWKAYTDCLFDYERKIYGRR